MHIGIMSMQRVENYGSYLQAYALRKTLEAMGHQVEFVDYFPESPIAEPPKPQTSDRPLIRILKMLSPTYRTWRKKQIHSNQTFHAFIHTYRTQWLPILGVSEKPNYLPSLDALVIGSDEVFNCTQPEKRVGFSRQLFGKDHQSKFLISYAASFGSTSLEKIKHYQIGAELTSLLSDFDYISVRDENSAQLIHTLLGINVPIHIDPVLLYPFPEVKQINVSMKNYIVIYAYAGRLTQAEIDVIQRFAQKTGKKLISLGFWQSFCDDYVVASPLEALAYIRHADYVLTDTFHGTIFSMIGAVPFGTIVRESNYQKLNSLLQQFGLENRQIKNPEDIESILLKSVDFLILKKKLQAERVKAMEYLRQALENKELY